VETSRRKERERGRHLHSKMEKASRRHHASNPHGPMKIRHVASAARGHSLF